MRDRLLGGLSPHAFMLRYWQKRPLLVRGALPGFRGLNGKRALAALAARHEVESRLVERRHGRWRVTHGPIAPARLRRSGPIDWTLLVSGVNLYHAAADRLLRRFDFLPQARLDDVMASYAVPGGGVGPHADSYDVFLVQGPGRRLWRLAPPRDWPLVAGAPLRLIEQFSPDEEILAEPGDLLYLPPAWGHDGVALDHCLTYSIGFRAPRGAELGAAFLDWLHARGLPQREYRDPGLRPCAQSARIPDSMLRHAAASLARMRWSRADVAGFLGEYLSTPKPHVSFVPRRRRLARAAFAQRLERTDAVLDRKTQLLYLGRRFYFNGDALAPRPAGRAALAELANTRRIAGRALARGGLAALACEWYHDGMLHLERVA